MNFMQKIISKAQRDVKTIVLPEAKDERIIRAAEKIVNEKIAKVILIGNVSSVKEDATKYGVSLDNVEIIDPKTYENLEEFVSTYVELRSKKGITYEEAKKVMTENERFFGAMLVKKGIAHGMVSGSLTPTADTLRAALRIIGLKKGINTLSSTMLLETNSDYGDNGVLLFGDCAVLPEPTSEQLADIAIASAENAKSLINIEKPKVALLSFSTKGSADHPSVDIVRKAVEILNAKTLDFDVDGEMQSDAAIVEAVGKKKAPNSSVAGKANVLVFPNLASGNIGYKLVQRFAKAKAIGPVLQGINAPINDLSRGCSVDDIANLTAITAVQSQG